MSDATKIEYVDASWSPLRGCSHVSPGCERCFAEQFAARNLPPFWGLTRNRRWTGEVRFIEAALTIPARWRRPRRVFVCDMADLFHPRVENAWIYLIWAAMRAAPQHTYLVLTKRAAGLRSWCARMAEMEEPAAPRLWIGVTVEDQARAEERIADLLATPAAVRWVSAEPLLGPLDLRAAIPHLDWIVVGGETGPGARPCNEEWIRTIIRDALEINAGCRVYVKQLGGWPDARRAPAQWPSDLRVREYPRSAS